MLDERRSEMLDETYCCHGCANLIELWDVDGGYDCECTLSPDTDPERVVRCSRRHVTERRAIGGDVRPGFAIAFDAAQDDWR